MQHDAWFFIGVFAFIFLVWVATGGPTHPLSFSGPFLSEPSPLGSGTYIGLPRAPFGIGGSDIELANPGSGGSSGGGPRPLKGVPFGTRSPYASEITLSHYVSGAGSSDPEHEYLQLSLSRSAKAPLTISGWELESAATGKAAVIPQGTEVPLSGTIQAIQPIVLQPGDSAIIGSGESPIGASFRENECIGYFGEFQQFYPSLPSCPDPSDDLERFYGPDYIRDSACITYVASLNSCTLSISPPPGLTSACDSFLENYLSYNGCVSGHQSDSGFKRPTWRVYLGRSDSMWRTRNEVVKLLDQNGDTVDAFAY
ncbi:MAG TPA: hypothetical protein VHC68_03375 [Candidatus Paceibacterota bacterium]|nr:hypothetical protein [Candidatus Paceibacterota bacterium]